MFFSSPNAFLLCGCKNTCLHIRSVSMPSIVRLYKPTKPDFSFYVFCCYKPTKPDFSFYVFCCYKPTKPDFSFYVFCCCVFHFTSACLVLTALVGAVAEYCNECVCVCVCLSASISPKPQAWSLPTFYACCLLLWISPPSAGWRNPKGRDSFEGFLPILDED